MKEKYHRVTYLKLFIGFLRPHIGGELLLFLLMIVSSAGSLATPYILKIIIDEIFPKGSYTQLVWILLILVLIYIIRIACSILTDLLYTNISQQVIAAIRTEVIHNILGRSMLFFKEAKAGDILFAVMNDVQNIQSAVSVLVLNLTTDILTVIGIVAMLSILNLKLTMISLLIMPIIVFSIRKFTPHLQNNFRKIQEIQEALNNFVLEKIKNIRVIRSYNTAAYEQESLHKLQQQDIRINTKNTLLSSLNTNITVFLVAIGPVIVLMYGGMAVFEKMLTLGSLIAFIQYLNRLYAPSMNIMNNYNNFTKALVSMERVHQYLVHPTGTHLEKTKNPAFQSVTFDNVSLIIEDKRILNNVNLRFEKGKIYGIIGPSGSGKSTISNLLCGFIQPTTGSILLDDQTPVSSLSDWQSALALIEKENQLFSRTILDNIRYGSFNASTEDVEIAITNAGLTEVLENQIQGINTPINDAGNTLSDGQKQRISIARALLKKADILIFDEATAALDLQLEQKIISALRTHHLEAIIIIITHRIQSLRSADHIYHIHNGTIVTGNTPDQLIASVISN